MRLRTPLNPDEGVVLPRQALLIGLQEDAHLLKRPASHVRARLDGQYLSRFKGRGMEFEEARPYQQGDDIRNMDWRVTARTNKPHSKVFREERERPVLVWVDFRSSMFFGSRTRFKSVQAARLAALLAWQAMQQGDRLGALVFRESKHLEIRPGRGKRSVLQLIRRLSEFSQQADSTASQDQSAFAHALTRLVQVTRPGSLLYLISDFRAASGSMQAGLSRLCAHNEVVLLQVYDPLEKRLPEAGRFRVTDGSDEVEFNASSPEMRRHYAHRFVDQEQALHSLARRYGARHLAVPTDADLRTALKPLRRLPAS